MSFRDHLQDLSIDQLRSEVAAADSVTVDSMETLAHHLHQLRAQVVQQQTALNVLTQLLIESKTVDAATLQARFKQATSAAQANANLIACVRCSKRVDRRATHMTGGGAMCDGCFSAYNADD